MFNKVLLKESNINDIAISINNKGVDFRGTTSEMPNAIMSISDGESITPSLVLSSDKIKTTGNVTLTATLTDTVNRPNETLNGQLENITIQFYDSNNQLKGTSVTDSNGIATLTTSISQNTTFYAKNSQIAVFQQVQSNNVTVEFTTEVNLISLWNDTNAHCYDGNISQVTVNNNTITAKSVIFVLMKESNSTIDVRNTNWELNFEFLPNTSNRFAIGFGDKDYYVRLAYDVSSSTPKGEPRIIERNETIETILEQAVPQGDIPLSSSVWHKCTAKCINKTLTIYYDDTYYCQFSIPSPLKTINVILNKWGGGNISIRNATLKL